MNAFADIVCQISLSILSRGQGVNHFLSFYFPDVLKTVDLCHSVSLDGEDI